MVAIGIVCFVCPPLSQITIDISWVDLTDRSGHGCAPGTIQAREKTRAACKSHSHGHKKSNKLQLAVFNLDPLHGREGQRKSNGHHKKLLHRKRVEIWRDIFCNWIYQTPMTPCRTMDGPIWTWFLWSKGNRSIFLTIMPPSPFLVKIIIPICFPPLPAFTLHYGHPSLYYRSIVCTFIASSLLSWTLFLRVDHPSKEPQFMCVSLGRFDQGAFCDLVPADQCNGYWDLS